MKTTFLHSAFLTALFLAISAFSLQAQSNSSDAHISGTLQDASGGGIAGVRVTARLDGITGAQMWTATSTTDGAYSLAFPAGRYRVQFVRQSFVSRDFVLDLAAGQSRKLDLRLDLERLSSSVVVTAQAEPTLVQDTSASVTVITRQEIDQRQAHRTVPVDQGGLA
jgi:hypothetical protein